MPLRDSSACNLVLTVRGVHAVVASSAAEVGALRKAELRAMIDPHPARGGHDRRRRRCSSWKAGRVTLVDTREETVYRRTHIPGAINMPFEVASRDGLRGAPHASRRRPSFIAVRESRTKEPVAKLAEQGVEVAFLEGGLGWEAFGLAHRATGPSVAPGQRGSQARALPSGERREGGRDHLAHGGAVLPRRSRARVELRLDLGRGRTGPPRP